MSKRKSPKVKVSKDTGNTIIKVAGLGLVAFFAYKMIGNSDTTSVLLGGGYSGSGTDLSGILPFLQETPPTFNISNPEIPSSFFINPSDVLTTTSTTGETVTQTKKELVTQTKKEFTTPKVPEKIVGNTSSSLLTNLFNPNYWLGSWGKDLSTEEYKLRQENNSKFALFRTPTEFINAGVNPIGFLINRFSPSNSGSGGGGGGCRSGNCPKTNDTLFTVDLGTTKKTTTINQSSNFNTAEDFLKSLRNNVQDRSITYTQNVMTPMEYGDYYNKKLAVIEQNAQNKLANSLASGNCGSAISTNACSGATRTTNYSNIVSNTANQSTRYYENTIANTKKELITVEMAR